MLTYIFDLLFSSNWSLIGNHWMNAHLHRLTLKKILTKLMLKNYWVVHYIQSTYVCLCVSVCVHDNLKIMVQST